MINLSSAVVVEGLLRIYSQGCIFYMHSVPSRASRAEAQLSHRDSQIPFIVLTAMVLTNINNLLGVVL